MRREEKLSSEGYFLKKVLLFILKLPLTDLYILVDSCKEAAISFKDVPEPDLILTLD